MLRKHRLIGSLCRLSRLTSGKPGAGVASYEGAQIWLRADTIIREQTQGRRSLDDFLRSFFGQRETGAIVVPYIRRKSKRRCRQFAGLTGTTSSRRPSTK